MVADSTEAGEKAKAPEAAAARMAAACDYGAKTRHGAILSFGHEPNGPWYPWGFRHVSPSTWVAAWRHIVTVFRQQGADDVTWLRTVNIIAAKGRIPASGPWWPASMYVTWVGIDGYYYRPSWQFASIIGSRAEAVTFSPDGQTLAAGDVDGSTYLWRLSDASLVGTFPIPGASQHVWAVAFSPSGGLLATGDRVGGADVWKIS